MEVYQHKVVQEINAMYGSLLRDRDSYDSIADHLDALSECLYTEVNQGNPAAFHEIRNYHWSHLGQSIEVLQKLKLGKSECRQTIANEYGFRRWSEVAHVRYPYHLVFEDTVDKMLLGDQDGLLKLLNADPSLVNQKSQYGHKATLLHYAVSNGVELWRQIVPSNLPELVDILLEKGANPKAKMLVYNGEYTAGELLMSSAHPRDAGVMAGMKASFDKVSL